MMYTLMHKNTPVADIEIDSVIGGISKIKNIWDAGRFPLGAARTGLPMDVRALNDWWVGRAIPASRSGLRDALDALGFKTTIPLLEKCLGLSLSDQYWVCPKDNPMSWKSVNFFENDFSEDVGNLLFGRTEANDDLDLKSPDNTSDGWLKKKWIIADGKRLLVKGGSAPVYQEPLNELLATCILRRLGNVPHVPYTLTWDGEHPMSVCEDFITTKTELISAWYVTRIKTKENHVSGYQHFLDCCEQLGINNVRDSIDKMLVLDYLIVNTDRHMNNFGIVRDADSLACLGLAPIYDCGTSMWHDTVTHRIRSEGQPDSKPFRSKHSDQIKLVSSIDWLNVSSLHGIDEEFSDILRKSPFIDDARRDRLCEALMSRLELLTQIQMEMQPPQIAVQQ